MNTPVVHGEEAAGAPGIVVANEVSTTEGSEAGDEATAGQDVGGRAEERPVGGYVWTFSEGAGRRR